jgi:hypothetical protein
MLGQPGGIFRTVLTGQLNSTPPPTGYFAGYEIGVKNGEND